MKVAIPTKSDKGLEDIVSDFFGKAKTYTILEVSDGSVINVETIDNPASDYKHGSGPIAVKMLSEKNIKAVAARELGVGASTLLEMNKIRKIKIKAGIPVKEAVPSIIKELEQ
jgi:predicted Fe-Mo cluster-binding NifX family protein